jgi:hypothetical protein
MRQLGEVLVEAGQERADRVFAAALKRVGNSVAICNTLLCALVTRLQHELDRCQEGFRRPLSSQEEEVETFAIPDYWEALALSAERLLKDCEGSVADAQQISLYMHLLALHGLVLSEFSRPTRKMSSASLLPLLGGFLVGLSKLPFSESEVIARSLSALTSVLPRLKAALSLRAQLLAIMLRVLCHIGPIASLQPALERVSDILDADLMRSLVKELGAKCSGRVQAALLLLGQVLMQSSRTNLMELVETQIEPILSRFIELSKRPELAEHLCTAICFLIPNSRRLGVDGVKLNSILHILLRIASSAKPSAVDHCLRVMAALLKYRALRIYERLGVFFEISKRMRRGHK